MIDRLVQLPALEMPIPEMQVGDVGTKGIGSSQHVETSLQGALGLDEATGDAVGHTLTDRPLCQHDRVIKVPSMR